MLGIFLNEIRSFPNWSANASLQFLGVPITHWSSIARQWTGLEILLHCFEADFFYGETEPGPTCTRQHRHWSQVYQCSKGWMRWIWILVLRLLSKSLRQGKRAVRYQSMCIVQAFRSPFSELKRQTCCCFYCGMFWWQGKTETTEKKKWVAPAEVWWNVERQLASIVMKCLFISFFLAGEHYAVPFECLKL